MHRDYSFHTNELTSSFPRPLSYILQDYEDVFPRGASTGIAIP